MVGVKEDSIFRNVLEFQLILNVDDT